MQLFGRRQIERLESEECDVSPAPVEATAALVMQLETTVRAEPPPAVIGIPMELYLLLYPNELEPEVVATLEAAGVPGYTEFPKMIGRGREHRHFDNQIWPGSVGGVLTILSAEQAPALVGPMQALNRQAEERTQGLHGVHMFRLPCQQIL
jgi:hypothetical protein